MKLKTPKDLAIKARMMGKKTISYSQLNMYKGCPLQWKLTYIDRHREYDPSMFLVFGTAMHEVLQHYLTTMYEQTAVAANAFDSNNMLKECMTSEYKKAVEETGKHFSDAKEMQEFSNEGVLIIDYFKKRRGAYFSKKNTELLGVEIPILCETDDNSNIMLMGFADIVMKQGDSITIYDIKTSMFGWRDKKKKSEGDQLRIYKRYFSKQYDVPEENINIEYFIVKRKLYENFDFPQKRIQQYRPPHGKVSMNKTKRLLSEFINHAFTDDGKHNKDTEYPALKTGCTYCAFKKNYELCPKENRRLVK